MRYFKSHQTTFQLFTQQDRLDNLAQDTSAHSKLLQSAIYAHVALTRDELDTLAARSPTQEALPSGSDYATTFYQYASAALLGNEADITSGCSSIQVLQTTILVALYEIQHADFRSAWLTVSRAVWLAQILKLNELDSAPLPSSGDGAAVEEARRALWAVHSLTWLLAIGGRAIDSISANEVDISFPFSLHYVLQCVHGWV